MRLKDLLLDFIRAIRIELTHRDYSPDTIVRRAGASTSKRAKHILGRRGEELARRFYEKRGAVILETNFIVGGVEIDIIAQEKGVLIFSEVKTRSGRDFDADPADAVDAERRARMIAAAKAYRRWQRLEAAPVRFDIIAIYWPKGKEPVLTPLCGAFREE